MPQTNEARLPVTKEGAEEAARAWIEARKYLLPPVPISLSVKYYDSVLKGRIVIVLVAQLSFNVIVTDDWVVTVLDPDDKFAYLSTAQPPG